MNPIKDGGNLNLTNIKNTIDVDNIDATKVNENNDAVKNGDNIGVT